MQRFEREMKRLAIPNQRPRRCVVNIASLLSTKSAVRLEPGTVRALLRRHHGAARNGDAPRKRVRHEDIHSVHHIRSGRRCTRFDCKGARSDGSRLSGVCAATAVAARCCPGGNAARRAGASRGG